MANNILIILGFLNFGFLFLAFMMNRMILLRIFAILSGLCGILYYSYISFYERFMWTDIFWVSLFVIVNIVQLYLIIHKSKKIVLNSFEKEIYEKYFSTLSELDFYRLISCSTVVDAEEGELLTEQNQKVGRLIFLVYGEANVNMDGKNIGTCKTGNFIGEFSFILNQPATATVTISKTSQYIMWVQEDLKKIMSDYPEMEFALKKILHTDLINKIKQFIPQAV